MAAMISKCFLLCRSYELRFILDDFNRPLLNSITWNCCGPMPVSVITAGGYGVVQHFVEGYQAGAAAVAAGTFFCQRDQNPMQSLSHIRNARLPIRLEV